MAGYSRHVFHKNIFALILVGILIFISCNKENNYNYLPQQLGELSLGKVIQNKKATVIINKMHAKRLDDCKNFIAIYGDNHSKNILYVSVYENSKKAETNLNNMALKMANGSSVFSPLLHSKMGDKVHFETEGMGLKHYFYRVDNILIWWQVEPDKAEATLSDLFKFDFVILKDRING
jgi:GTPase involved in cell partitioning and DNA repair